jgi:hypothetical protein
MIDNDVMRLTLATSENGRKALQQIFAPRKRAPAFSKWIPAKGFGAVRISGNLREFFTGVQALMPPAVPAALRGQVGLAKLGLAAVGLDWSSVTEAFTGHAVIAFKPASKGPPEVIGLVALGNPSKADQLLDAVEKSAGRFMRQMGDSPIKKTTIEGLPARSVALGRQSIHVVRAGDMLVFASSAALAAETVKRGKSGANSLSGTSAAALLDGEVVLAFTMDLKSMLPPSAPAEMAKVFETMEPMEAAIRLEKHGLVADGKSMAVLTGVGLSAYLLTAKVEESQREAVEALERARAAEEAHRKRLEVMKKAAPEAPQ